MPDHKNLYIFGTQQVRYGIGPLITPASKLIAKMVKLQDELELPICIVQKESGSKLPTTHLIGTIKSLGFVDIRRNFLKVPLGTVCL